VRRLFSNFARGWPGFGLLLLRCAAGVTLIVSGVENILGGQTVLGWAAIGAGALLVAGLWTPVAGFLLILLSLFELLRHHETLCSDILMVAMGAALALVGPGAFSLDAWLFGMRRIDIEKLQGPPRR
jgi:putative oxidoreductase